MKIALSWRGGTKADTSQDEYFARFYCTRAEQIAGCCPVFEHPADTVILREGQPPKVIYVIENGLVKLSQVQPTGLVVAAGIRGTNWLLGAAASLLGVSYSFTATTLTDCSLRMIRTTDFAAHLRNDADFAEHLCKMLSWEIKNNLSKVVELGAMRGRQRLERLLAEMVREVHRCGRSDGKELYFSLKQYELAQLICVTPEHLCRIMKDMERDNLIGRSKGKIVIPDPDRLLERLPPAA